MARAETVQADPDEILVTAQPAVIHAWTYFFAVLIVLAGAVIRFACVPLAIVIAGKQTDFVVNVSFGVSVTLSLVGIGGTTYGVVQRHRVRALKRRNRELARQLLQRRGAVVSAEDDQS